MHDEKEIAEENAVAVLLRIAFTQDPVLFCHCFRPSINKRRETEKERERRDHHYYWNDMKELMDPECRKGDDNNDYI